MINMKAWTITGPAPHTLADLKLTDVAEPTPGDTEVKVYVRAVGLNPADYKVIAGSNTTPRVVGMDCAGEIVAVGANVTNWSVGDRVMYHGDLRRAGSLAEFTVTTALSLAPIPSNVSFEQAAASLCGTLTAYQALYRKANLSEVPTVLIHAGGGAVGLAALQFAHDLNLPTIATTSARKRPLVERVGADTIIDYHQEDVTAAVMAATDGLGVGLSLNTIGGEELAADVERMAYNGQIIAIGDGMPAHLDLDSKALGLVRSALGGVYGSNNPTEIADLGFMAGVVGQKLATGEFDPVIDRILPFDDAAEGLNILQRGDNLGKLVVKVD
ncbi:alcohol dehydrogenase [Levilactobacillus suantsaiihabitans]|uniref:Alcohol dehydrogenase n=2 Tax=Levilactobacillus suantsaiihabitans TaxID=2487722 RepID=A0A4Z0J727_9LACO|nr:alcohol dehydrogenase [Levilactobacillus suantsaiihabitans]